MTDLAASGEPLSSERGAICAYAAGLASERGGIPPPAPAEPTAAGTPFGGGCAAFGCGQLGIQLSCGDVGFALTTAPRCTCMPGQVAERFGLDGTLVEAQASDRDPAAAMPVVQANFRTGIDGRQPQFGLGLGNSFFR